MFLNLNKECNQPTILQALKIALAQIRICSRLEGLLLKKKNLSNGDYAEVHAQKVHFFFVTVSFGKVGGRITRVTGCIFMHEK